MNKVILVGRLTRDPELRYSQGDNPLAITRYTLAVDRRKQGEADFIPCTVFGKSAEFAEKYFRKGLRVAVSGRIQTGSYKNKEGQTVYTTEVIVEEQEFAQSKSESNFEGGYNNRPENEAPAPSNSEAAKDGFMKIPNGINEELPFI